MALLISITKFESAIFCITVGSVTTLYVPIPNNKIHSAYNKKWISLSIFLYSKKFQITKLNNSIIICNITIFLIKIFKLSL